MVCEEIFARVFIHWILIYIRCIGLKFICHGPEIALKHKLLFQKIYLFNMLIVRQTNNSTVLHRNIDNAYKQNQIMSVSSLCIDCVHSAFTTYQRKCFSYWFNSLGNIFFTYLHFVAKDMVPFFCRLNSIPL